MDDQARSARAVETDPIRVLENTRRTLLQLVANIDAAIAAAKGSARSR
jgi:hypothetical protein